MQLTARIQHLDGIILHGVLLLDIIYRYGARRGIKLSYYHWEQYPVEDQTISLISQLNTHASFLLKNFNLLGKPYTNCIEKEVKKGYEDTNGP